MSADTDPDPNNDLLWADEVEDWSAFWANDNLFLDEYGLGVEEDEDGNRIAKAVPPQARALIIEKALPKLRERSNFIGLDPLSVDDPATTTPPAMADPPAPVSNQRRFFNRASQTNNMTFIDVGTTDSRNVAHGTWSFFPAALQEPLLTEWDLRARMEKRRQQAYQNADWERRKSMIGTFSALDMEGDIRLGPLPYETPEELDL